MQEEKLAPLHVPRLEGKNLPSLCDRSSNRRRHGGLGKAEES